MDRVLLILPLLVILGLILGYRTAQSSQKREGIHGGPMAQIFHYLACAIFSVTTPTVLTSIFIFHVGIVRAFIIAFSMLGVAFILLILFAVFEQPARQKRTDSDDERGWTAEDALKSGL